MPADAWMITPAELTARMLDHGTRELASLIHAMPPTSTPVVWGQQVCRLGTPGQLVVQIADELHVDLIVAGSHGYNVLDRFLGTTAARIVNHARCSVLIVRAPPAA